MRSAGSNIESGVSNTHREAERVWEIVVVIP